MPVRVPPPGMRMFTVTPNLAKSFAMMCDSESDPAREGPYEMTPFIFLIMLSVTLMLMIRPLSAFRRCGTTSLDVRK